VNRKKQQQFEDDDGRVICSMDVDGMPGRFRRSTENSQPNPVISDSDQLTKTEARYFTASALLAALMIGTVFSLTWVLFTLFLTKVVFR
jgi:hypothetical protein